MSNYNAIIAKITAVTPIKNSDFIQSAFVLGESVIVNISHKVGDVGVFFPVGSALSHDMCHHNNLYRNSAMNKDQEKSGFLEANGRITAMKMRGVVSCGLFLPLESVSWAGDCPIKVGESFGEIGKNKICSRYNPPAKQHSQGTGKTSTKGKQAPKFIAPYFEKHIDTSQFKFNVSSIQKGSVLYFHAKFHGTSARQQLGKVEKRLPNWKNTINNISYKLLGKNIFSPDSDYEMIIGSRNVLINDKGNSGYYGTNEFRIRAAEMITPHLRKGMTIYSELVGYIGGGSTIMPDHTTTKLGCKESVKKYGENIRYAYGCREGELRNIIYRITLTTDDGMVMDLPQKSMEAWCSQRGLEHTLEIHEPIVYDGDEKALRELVERLTERPECLTECYDSPTQISEGIIIREECGTLIPKFYKSKSTRFRIMEGLQTEADLEESS